MTAPNRTNGLTQEMIQSACESKNRYSDRLTAIAMGISQTERHGEKLYTYRCRICKGWHLTKNGRGINGNPVYPCNLKSFV